MSEKIIETTGEVVEIVDDLDTTGLIEVKQLPVIVEHLLQIRDMVTERVESALALECTEDNKQAVKAARSDLNKLFKELEDKRKEVKAKVLKPYEDFEAVYKECVTNIFKPADVQLRDKIAAVEDEQKRQKRQKALEYFEEYREALGIDFVSFDDVGLNITLNVSDKKLKEECKTFLDRVMEGLDLIATQEHQEEILVEFKETLNAASAITVVKNRYQRIEEERKRREEAEERKRAEAERQAELDAILAEEEILPDFEDEAFVAPTAEDISVPDESEPEEQRKKYVVAFKYETYNKASIGQLVAIMKQEGTYEQL
ncbi:MAG: DUF1351 domain-containing protein [Eubacterium sp.]|nr:DUF1351 domain-containing protein [Eubacterium sp.]